MDGISLVKENNKMKWKQYIQSGTNTWHDFGLFEYRRSLPEYGIIEFNDSYVDYNY